MTDIMLLFQFCHLGQDKLLIHAPRDWTADHGEWQHGWVTDDDIRALRLSSHEVRLVIRRSIHEHGEHIAIEPDSNELTISHEHYVTTIAIRQHTVATAAAAATVAFNRPDESNELLE